MVFLNEAAIAETLARLEQSEREQALAKIPPIPKPPAPAKPEPLDGTAMLHIVEVIFWPIALICYLVIGLVFAASDASN